MFESVPNFLRRGIANRSLVVVPCVVVCLLAVLMACLPGCVDRVPDNGSRLQVAVTLLPQAEIAQSVGGERVCITVIVPPGAEPHTYEPSAAQLVQVSRSDVYFRLGPGLLPFEDTLVERIRTLNPGIRVVDTSEGINPIEKDADSLGGPQGKNPHIWLSPSNIGIMAVNMERGLAGADPLFRAEYEANTRAYLQKTEATDHNIRATLSGLEGRSFLVFHPAWDYFAREYDLVQIAVEKEGKEPTARDLSTLINRARDQGIRVVFAEPQFPTRGAEEIAREINGTVVLLDPLAPHTLANLEQVASAIRDSYKPESRGGGT